MATSTKIMTFNLNGIRSAMGKGFGDWLRRQSCDVVCLQEIRANQNQIPKGLEHFQHQYWHPATTKAGYSGVGVLTQKEPEKVSTNFGCELVDGEGRFIEVLYEGLTVISFYMLNGSSCELRLDKKYQTMKKLQDYLRQLSSSGKSVVFCSDLNIAHKEIDLKNWRANQNRSGFLPEERKWLDRLVEKDGYIDAFRHVHPNKEAYTWWSQRGSARANNVGWRIDYQLTTPNLADKIEKVAIYKTKLLSDHAPQILTLGR